MTFIPFIFYLHQRSNLRDLSFTMNVGSTPSSLARSPVMEELRFILALPFRALSRLHGCRVSPCISWCFPFSYQPLYGILGILSIIPANTKFSHPSYPRHYGHLRTSSFDTPHTPFSEALHLTSQRPAIHVLALSLHQPSTIPPLLSHHNSPP